MKKIADLCYGDMAAQRLDLYLPEEASFPVFVYFHGGGLESGDKSDDEAKAKALTDRGIAMVSANYRMYPHAAYPDFVRDAARAVAWVCRHIGEYGECSEIYVGGSSAGGYLSMMLCFDRRWLAEHGIAADAIAGYIHDAGQPTCHYNVLRERGIDTRRVMIDDSAPIYHVGEETAHPRMLFIVSDNDMPGRYEQTKLMLATLRNFGLDGNVRLTEMHGTHCAYVGALNERGESVFGKMAADYILQHNRRGPYRRGRSKDQEK